MKVKCKLKWVLERKPEFCGECPAFSLHEYQCHNERGYVASCALGYMAGHDMRDYGGGRLFPGCNIENDSDVTIGEPYGRIDGQSSEQ